MPNPCLRILLLAGFAVACGPDQGADRPASETAVPMTSDAPEIDPQLVFWSQLEALCGRAFEGRVVESVPPDESFDGQRLVMHVRSCEPAEIRVPFFVGPDRSRTWVFTTTATGLRLKHDHRHEDGSADAVTDYGGDSYGRGTNTLQEFPADSYTAELVPTAATNVWSVELRPGEVFAYDLRREGSDRRFRAEFDLSAEIAEPPPPWGR